MAAAEATPPPSPRASAEDPAATFAGVWEKGSNLEHAGFLVATIVEDGGVVTFKWLDNSVTAAKVDGNTIETTFQGDSFQGTLENGEIRWSDGDVWVRKPQAAVAEGDAAAASAAAQGGGASWEAVLGDDRRGRGRAPREGQDDEAYKGVPTGTAGVEEAATPLRGVRASPAGMAPALAAAPLEDKLPPSLERLSRQFASVLRHRAPDADISVRGDGFAKLSQVLSTGGVRQSLEDAAPGASAALANSSGAVPAEIMGVVKRLVAGSFTRGFPRFELWEDNQQDWWIRATHKHSLAHVQVPGHS